MLPLAHAQAWIAASVLLVATALSVSLAPFGGGVLTTAYIDKFQHALAFAFLTVWFAGLVARPHYWKVALGLAAFGLLIEWLQHVTALGRHAELLDMVANVVGIAVGMALAVRSLGAWATRVEAWLARN